MSYEYIRPTSQWKQKKTHSKGLKKFFKKGRLKNILLVCLVLIVALSLFSLAAFAWISRDLPDPNALLKRDVAQSTKIYDRTGTHLLYEIHGNQNRTLVKLEDIPEMVKQATISVEDQQFYKHIGFNPFRMVFGIVWGVITTGRPTGGSTITQQLVKNAILTNERSITRKLKELILSVAIEQRFTKDQILQLYLNEIPYGSTNYGIGAAAESYFGKSIKDVDLAEAATLAGLPKEPTTYLNDPIKLDARRDTVLELMYSQGYITKEQKDQAQAEDVQIHTTADAANATFLHFVFYVKQQLEDQYGFDERQIDQGGLSVITTLDYDKQLMAEQSIKDGVEAKGSQYHFGDAALVAIDPKTGQVLSMVGSKDYFDADISGAVNMALYPIQPGSSFKPIVYTDGFLKGYTPNTILYDVGTTFKTEISDYTPQNYHAGSESGPVTVRKALQGSLNIPAVKMLSLVGVQNILDFAESLGYTTFTDRSRFGLAIVLGGGEVKLIEHTAAYGVFANEGVKQDTTTILKVTDTTGTALYEWKPSPGKQVIDANATREISNVLSDNAARAYIFGASNHLTLSDRLVAVKTGTTNNNISALTMGYTPSLVAGVWVGNANNKPMAAGADGSIVAAPIWQEFMQKATAGTPVESFTTPIIPITGKDLIDGKLPSTIVVVDKSTGKLATDSTPESMRQTLSCGEYHSELYYINPDDPLGAAPGVQPDNAQYVNWEAGVQAWVSDTLAKDPTKLPFTPCAIPTSSDDVHTRQNQPGISIVGSSVSGRSVTVEVSANAPRGISRIEYFIDNTFVATSSSSTGATFSLPSSVGPGQHALKAIAFDDVDNNNSDSQNITVVDAANEAAIDIIDPVNNQTIEKTGADYKIIVQISNPSQVSQVTLTATPLRGGTTITVGTVDQPNTPFVTFTWSLPVAGDYVLTASNNQTTAQAIVTVKDAPTTNTGVDLRATEPTDATVTDATPTTTL